ncbi:uncharacterized protein LOC142339609 [Convolutriloba macropyga]|uniref:uncharacterized protein LOC142339609 n=1 Tax=Convolutriloba macropyga TaxID=536237 RepID=UPI003F5205A7
MNMNRLGPRETRATMSRSASLPPGGYSIPSGNPGMGAMPRHPAMMNGGGGGGVANMSMMPMQSANFRAGDTSMVNRFPTSMRPPGGFNMSGGGITSRPGMGGTSGMFGGGGGGGGMSNSMAMMGRPQSAQMMAPSFSSSSQFNSAPPRFNQMMPSRNNPTGYNPHPGRASLTGMPPASTIRAAGRPSSGLAQSAGYMQYYPKPISGPAMAAGSAGGMKPFGDMAKAFMPPSRPSSASMMDSMARPPPGVPMTMAQRSTIGKNKRVEINPVATRQFY